MNLFTIIISGMIVIWIILAIRYIYHNKNNGCSGKCRGCEKKCPYK